MSIIKLFYDGGPYYIETSPLICRANQWTGVYMIVISDMKERIMQFVRKSPAVSIEGIA